MLLQAIFVKAPPKTTVIGLKKRKQVKRFSCLYRDESGCRLSPSPVHSAVEKVLALQEASFDINCCRSAVCTLECFVCFVYLQHFSFLKGEGGKLLTNKTVVCVCVCVCVCE